MHHPFQPNPQAALPLHLTLAMLPWLASSAALRLSSADSQLLKQLKPLPTQSQNIQELFALWQRLLNDRQLAKAAEAEAKSRAAEFLQGLLRYQAMPYRPETETFPCVMQTGSVRLLDCGGAERGPRVLLVPSLINRYYILNLTRKLSLARYLAGQGMRVYLVDWGSPSKAEIPFDCGAYVAKRLTPMAEWIKASSRKPLIAAGYCMGGLFALALAGTRPDLVDSLACFATPWDFSTEDFPKIVLGAQEQEMLRKHIASRDTLPAETIHTLFHLANPFAFQHKLREFSHMKQGSPQMDDFMAIEHWVQDGVPMTRGAAEDCLIGWAQRNRPARLEWKVADKIVNPATLRCPVFIAAPKDDKIVPSSSALPLARLCSKSVLIEPASGHVGMIVGRGRKNALWDPFVQWINGHYA